MLHPTSSPPVSIPTGALVAAALLLAGPVDPSSHLGGFAAADFRALDACGLLDRGGLVPGFASLIEVVAWPDLVAEVAREQPEEAPARTLVWALPSLAVLGRATGASISIEPIEIGDIADTLVTACGVSDRRPPVEDERLAATLLRSLLAGDGPKVAAVLDQAHDARSPDAASLLDVVGVAPNRWRVETAWTDHHGPVGGTVAGFHAGSLGAWQVVGSSQPLDVQPIDRSSLRHRIAALLPPEARGGPADRAAGRTVEACS